MEQYDVDKYILDMIYDEEIREDYVDLVIEDLIEEIEDLESEDTKEITEVGTLNDIELNT